MLGFPLKSSERYHTCDANSKVSIDFRQGTIKRTLNGKAETVSVPIVLEKCRSFHLYVSDADALVFIDDKQTIADNTFIHSYEHLNASRVDIVFPNNGTLPPIASFGIVASDSPWLVYKNALTIGNDIVSLANIAVDADGEIILQRHYAGFDQLIITVKNEGNANPAIISLENSPDATNWFEVPNAQDIPLPPTDSIEITSQVKYPYVRVSGVSATGTTVFVSSVAIR